MGKLHFWFPVLYHGLLIHSSVGLDSKRKNQPDIIYTITLDDRLDNGDISRRLSGKASALQWSYFWNKTNMEEKCQRVRNLKIGGLSLKASAFHRFLTEETDLDVDHRHKLDAIIEKAEDADSGAVKYVTELITIAFQSDYSGFPDMVNAFEAKKEELHGVALKEDAIDLFSLPKEEREKALIAFAPSGLKIIATEAIPYVIKGVFSLLYSNKDDETGIEKLQAGDFHGFLRAQYENHQLSAYDYYKWNNALNIASQAQENLEHAPDREQDYVDREFDFDWFMRFFDAAGNVRDEDMQSLWARILSGEVVTPGKFSFRTIDTLKNMSKHDAAVFLKVCSIMLRDDHGQPFIFIDESCKMLKNSMFDVYETDISLLQEIGILNYFKRQDETGLLGTKELIGFYNDSYDAIIFDRTKDTTIHRVSYERYLFSKTGQELLQVAHTTPNGQYIAALAREVYSQSNEQYSVNVCKVVRINDDGSIVEIRNEEPITSSLDDFYLHHYRGEP